MKFIKDFFAKRKAKREEKLVGYLNEANVPQELHAEALASVALSRSLYFKFVFWIKLTAWIVCLPMVWCMKWEDEDVPKFFRWYGNNVSPNGDRSNWKEDAEHYGRRLPQPLDKNAKLTDYGEKFNYYAWDFHVRFWLSRYVWMGWRNPGGGRALQVGPNVFAYRKLDENKRFQWDIHKWGIDNVGNKVDGKVVLGTRVMCIGPHWQITNFRERDSFFGMETNVGYKINILASDFAANEPTAALCVCNGVKPFRA